MRGNYPSSGCAFNGGGGGGGCPGQLNVDTLYIELHINLINTVYLHLGCLNQLNILISPGAANGIGGSVLPAMRDPTPEEKEKVGSTYVLKLVVVCSYQIRLSV